MEMSEVKFTSKQVIITARILLAIMTPALVLSAYRALTQDGAIGIVAVQAVLWCILLITCFEPVSLGLRARVTLLAGMVLIVALGAMVRNQSFQASTPLSVLAVIYLSLIAGPRLKYLIVPVIIGFMAGVAWVMNYATATALASHSISISGIMIAAILLISSLRQRAEARAREAIDAKNRLELMTRQGDVGLFDLDLEAQTFSGNDVWKAYFGFDPSTESISVKEFLSKLAPEAAATASQSLATVREAPVGFEQTRTLQQQRADGSMRWVRLIEQKIERDGRTYMIGSLVDVTQETETARQAQDLKDRIDLVSRSGGVGMIEFFPDTKTFKCNAEMTNRLGVPASDEERSIDLFYAHQPEEIRAYYQQKTAQQLQSASNTLTNFTHPFYLPSGEKRYYRVSRSSRALNGRLSFLGLSLDVTDEIRATEAAETRTQMLDFVSNAGGIAYFEVNFDAMTIQGNELLYARDGLSSEIGAYSLAEVLARVPEYARDQMQAEIAQAMQRPEGETYSFNHPYIKADGAVIEVRVTASNSMRNGVLWAFGSSVDITEEIERQKLIEQQLKIINTQNERINQALDFAGIWLFEENVSKGSGKLLRSQSKYEDEELLVGPARLAATDPQYRAKIEESLARIGETVDFPLNFSQGSRKWVRNMTIDEYTDSAGDTIRLQLSEDITEFREQQISLESAIKALNDKSEKQAQIFAIIGHELRTPLSSMKMMEEAMGLRNIGEYGANICESTDAVLNIVDDLRTVINPDKAHEALAVVDSPFDVLTRTTRSLEGLYEQQGVEVQLTSNQLAHSLCKFNAQALRQKVTNLTKNAAIHAEADTIWVDLQAQPRSDDKIELTLTVEDNGKGIPDGLREAVFGAFSRGDSRADGTGLGLYITRELAEKLGGTVEYFESEKGGAGFKVEFTLDLHLDAIGQENELDETVIPVALQGKRILFAEDQKTLQMLTANLLRNAGAEVVVCDNGQQALEAFRAGEFDIVLTDLMMPEMNGDELIRHIRADGFTGQIVALTAAIIGNETDTLLEAGANAVLNKPLDIHEMKRTVAVLEQAGSAA